MSRPDRENRKADPARAWEGLLAPDERIIWQGRPVARLAFRPSDISNDETDAFA